MARSSGLLVAVSMWAVTVGIIPVMAIGPLAPFMLKEGTIRRPDVGLLYGLFHLGGVLCSVGMGRLADRWGPRRALSLMAILTTGAVIGLSASPAMMWMGMAALVAGAAFAAANPSTNKLIAERFGAARSFGPAMGVKQSGVPLASALAGSLLPLGAAMLGWRTSYALIAVGTLALLIMVARVHPPAGATSAHAAVEDERAPDIVTLHALAVFGAGMGFAVSPTMAYFVLYLVEDLGAVGAIGAGYVFSAAAALGIVGRILWATNTTGSRPGRNLLAVSLGGALTTGVLALGIPVGGWLLAVLTVAMGAFVFGWSGAFQVTLVRVSGPRVGTGSGIALTGFSLGLMLGPLAFAWILGQSSRYAPAWLAVTGSFLVACAAGAFVLARSLTHDNGGWT